MRKKLIFLTTFVLMFGLISSAGAAVITTIWTGAVDQDWSNAGNWSMGVPDNDDKATFEPGPALGAIIDHLDAAVCGRVALGHIIAGTAPALTMNCGTLTVSAEVYIGGDDSTHLNEIGIFNLNGGIVTVPDKFFTGYYGTGYFTMTGGTVNCGRFYVAGEKSDSHGHADISCGTINASTRVRVGGKTNSTGYLTLSGGKIITPALEIAPNATGTIGEVTLAGGIIDTGTLLIGNTGLLDIQLGSLLLAGNQIASIQAYITSGQIIAWDGSGQVLANYHPCWDKTIVNAIIPEPATMTLLGLGGLALLRRRK